LKKKGSIKLRGYQKAMTQIESLKDQKHFLKAKAYLIERNKKI